METNWVKYRIEDGILYATYKQNLSVNLEEAKEMVAERLAFQKGVVYPIIIHMNGIKASSKEARIYMSKDGIVGISMGAFIAGNSIEKALLNFFLKIEKPPVPARFFTKEEEAIEWINAQRKH